MAKPGSKEHQANLGPMDLMDVLDKPDLVGVQGNMAKRGHQVPEDLLGPKVLSGL